MGWDTWRENKPSPQAAIVYHRFLHENRHETLIPFAPPFGQSQPPPHGLASSSSRKIPIMQSAYDIGWQSLERAQAKTGTGTWSKEGKQLSEDAGA